ncbi:MAG: DUF3127 domain-containing protein [Bacteroidota bacterium]
MKVTGKIIEIQETQQVSDTFRKRTFILEYAENPQYLEYISFELVQDRCELLDSFQPGQDIEVSFNLRGRKWVNPEGVTKYFNTLQAWRLEATASATPHVVSSEEKLVAKDTATSNNEEDDLPF